MLLKYFFITNFFRLDFYRPSIIFNFFSNECRFLNNASQPEKYFGYSLFNVSYRLFFLKFLVPYCFSELGFKLF